MNSRRYWLVLVILTCVAFAFRIYRIADVGLAEDEVHKVLAVESYRAGVFTVNAEHPMLMKMAGTASFVIADWWNGSVAPAYDLPMVSDELAIRFPNVLVGSLTTLVLFLLARTFFGPAVGLISAAFWAVGINAITYNRIAKEDTFLVFFVLLGLFCYQQAKQVVPRIQRKERLWYAASGASFGLALASKYFPHYLAITFVFYYFARIYGLDNRQHCRSTKQAFWFPFLIFFLVFNPLILYPGIWDYLLSYAAGHTMTHHGYQVMGQLYHNEPAYGPYGTPVYFYLLYLFVKLPVSLLFLVGIGLAVVWTRRKSQIGALFLLFMFLVWIVPYSLAGGKWLRYTLSLTPWLYMLAAIGVVWLAEELAVIVGSSTRLAGAVSLTVIFGVCLISMTQVSLQSAPYYSLFVNRLGGGEQKAGHYFPHDEFYDVGLREALDYVARSSPHSSAVYSDAGDLVTYYSRRFGRPDLRHDSLCNGDPHESAENYVLFQEGRRYYENAARLDKIRRTMKPEKEIVVQGIPAVSIYRLEGLLEARTRNGN